MTLEQQVCSRELAEKLHDLGVKQESLFDWVKGDGEMGAGFDWHISKHDGDRHTWDKQFSAFTVAELGEMLPFELRWKIKKGDCKNTCRVHNEFVVAQCECSLDGSHLVAYSFGAEGEEDFFSHHWLVEDGDTEADARAKMFVYLLENKLI